MSHSLFMLPTFPHIIYIAPKRNAHIVTMPTSTAIFATFDLKH